MAAPLVRRSRGVLVGGCETIRAGSGVQPGAGLPGQGARLHTADAGRPTVVPLVMPGTGPAGRDRRDLPIDLADHGATVVVRGRPQAVAVPIVDLHHRPRLPAKGAAGTGPVPADVGRETVGPERVRDLRRREDLHPGPVPLPPHPATGQGPDDAG